MDRESRERWERYFVAVLPAAMAGLERDIREIGGATAERLAERRLSAVREARLFADAALEESNAVEYVRGARST